MSPHKRGPHKKTLLPNIIVCNRYTNFKMNTQILRIICFELETNFALLFAIKSNFKYFFFQIVIATQIIF